MPRQSKYPRLRRHVRRASKSGRVTVYYFYDRRPDGKPDVPLGTDYDAAIKQWEEIHNRKPRIAGTIEEAFERWELEVLPNYANAGTRRNYAAHLKRLRPVFGPSTWDAVEFTDLKAYLKARRAKTQGNREMALLSIVWNWARGDEDLSRHCRVPFPAAGMERSRWKNKERARRFHVTDELFAAVYAEADQVLRDCMDIASATGMRLTDCREVLLPRGDVLRLEASKTGKAADFDLGLSAVLPDLLKRRRAISANHLMLLSTPTGRRVSPTMLRSRWDAARRAAAAKADEQAAEAAGEEQERLQALAEAIRAMFLRDMRKLAGTLAGSDAEAAELLQHSDVRLTRRHYRTAVQRLKPVR